MWVWLTLAALLRHCTWYRFAFSASRGQDWLSSWTSFGYIGRYRRAVLKIFLAVLSCKKIGTNQSPRISGPTNQNAVCTALPRVPFKRSDSRLFPFWNVLINCACLLRTENLWRLEISKSLNTCWSKQVEKSALFKNGALETYAIVFIAYFQSAKYKQRIYYCQYKCLTCNVLCVSNEIILNTLLALLYLECFLLKAIIIKNCLQVTCCAFPVNYTWRKTCIITVWWKPMVAMFRHSMTVTCTAYRIVVQHNTYVIKSNKNRNVM